MNIMKAEFIKMKHSKYYMCQLFITLGITFLLAAYYYMYARRDPQRAIKTIYECLGLVIPMVSTITGYLLLYQEEKISNMWGMLFVVDKKKTLLGKLGFMHLTQMCVMSVPTIILMMIVHIDGVAKIDIFGLFLGYMILSLVLDGIHLFVNILFGGSISIFLGIIETVEIILASNVAFSGAFRYLPCSWLMEWKETVFQHNFMNQAMYLGSCLVIDVAVLILVMLWFEKWEGRKTVGIM